VDLLDRFLIIRTTPYTLPEISSILSIRSNLEHITLTSSALQLLSQRGMESSLRYAIQLITPCSILARAKIGLLNDDNNNIANGSSNSNDTHRINVIGGTDSSTLNGERMEIEDTTTTTTTINQQQQQQLSSSSTSYVEVGVEEVKDAEKLFLDGKRSAKIVANDSGNWLT